MASVKNIKHIEIRPRFILTSKASVETICGRYKAILLTKQRPFSGKVRHGYISIIPSEEYRHYWSPHLSITVEPCEEDESLTLLKGLYGPSPSVWTMFVFIYAIVALTTVIITVIGLANISIDESGQILWALPFLVILFLSIYATSYLGQSKGKDQIKEIDEFFVTILSDINNSNFVR